MIAKYTAFVTDMEAGTYPACLTDRNAAIKRLLEDICGFPWETAEQRESAQKLVARLERLARQALDNVTPAHEPHPTSLKKRRGKEPIPA